MKIDLNYNDIDFKEKKHCAGGSIRHMFHVKHGVDDKERI